MEELEQVAEKIREMILSLGGDPINEDLVTPADGNVEKDY